MALNMVYTIRTILTMVKLYNFFVVKTCIILFGDNVGFYTHTKQVYKYFTSFVYNLRQQYINRKNKEN